MNGTMSCAWGIENSASWENAKEMAELEIIKWRDE